MISSNSIGIEDLLSIWVLFVLMVFLMECINMELKNPKVKTIRIIIPVISQFLPRIWM